MRPERKSSALAGSVFEVESASKMCWLHLVTHMSLSWGARLASISIMAVKETMQRDGCAMYLNIIWIYLKPKHSFTRYSWKKRIACDNSLLIWERYTQHLRSDPVQRAAGQKHIVKQDFCFQQNISHDVYIVVYRIRLCRVRSLCSSSQLSWQKTHLYKRVMISFSKCSIICVTWVSVEPEIKNIIKTEHCHIFKISRTWWLEVICTHPWST